MKSHLALLAASALACARPVCAAAPLPPPADQALARDMLKSLVEINTTHEHGSTAASANPCSSWATSMWWKPNRRTGPSIRSDERVGVQESVDFTYRLIKAMSRLTGP